MPASTGAVMLFILAVSAGTDLQTRRAWLNIILQLFEHAYT
jgi:hypothetical protein